MQSRTNSLYIVLCLIAACSADLDADPAAPRAAVPDAERAADENAAPASSLAPQAGSSVDFARLNGAPNTAVPAPTAASTQKAGVPSGPVPASNASASASAGASAAAPIKPMTPVTGDKFADVGSNPFVFTAHDPFSTFAADVDTASYDIFRRDIEHHVATNPSSVRVEEFVNYFDYDYAAPAAAAEDPFKINLALTENPLGRDSWFVRVGIQAKNPPAAEKKPANLVFLVDTSGSMQTEEKMPLVQYVLTHSLDVLDADDKVTVVSYAGSTMVRLPPTSVAEKDKIAAVINGLTANGGTNGSSGIQLAYEQAQAAFIQDGINHVILCTDGDFNIGISDTDALVELIKDKRKSGITLTALGFGIGNLNDAMMEKVSNAGNGIYSVITSRTQASRYAEERMLSTFVHVAKDMKIQLEWNPAHVLAYRLVGYEDRAIADKDFRNDLVDAGEVGAGHRVTALYEVVPKGKQVPQLQGAAPAQDGAAVEGTREITASDMVLVKVRYKQPNATETDPAREVVEKIAATELPSSFAAADKNLRWTVAIASFAEGLKHSPYATTSQRDVQRTVFTEQQDRDIERKEFLQLFEASAALP